jgi:hypothetical protein
MKQASRRHPGNPEEHPMSKPVKMSEPELAAAFGFMAGAALIAHAMEELANRQLGQ